MRISKEAIAKRESVSEKKEYSENLQRRSEVDFENAVPVNNANALSASYKNRNFNDNGNNDFVIGGGDGDDDDDNNNHAMVISSERKPF